MSRMSFTHHAVERYMQFHMLDRPDATEADARAILEQHAESAVRVQHRTLRGDPVWNIEALGIEVVAKREGDVDVAVTVLPPPQFRGLTPLQAERVAARVAIAAEEVRTVKQAVVDEAKVSQTPHQLEVDRIRDLKNRHAFAVNEQALMMSLLKTIRREIYQADLKQALRIALRHLRASKGPGATEALAQIGEVRAGFLLDAFIDTPPV